MRLIDADRLMGDFLCTFYNDLDDQNRTEKLINDAQTVEERPHGKWIYRRIIGKNRSVDMVVCSNCQTEFSYDAETGVSMDNYNTCPNCGADMQTNDRQITGKLNSEIEKLKSEIENSDLPERFTSTDCSCLNCKNRNSVHCEPQNKKIYGYCGNWERR